MPDQLTDAEIASLRELIATRPKPINWQPVVEWGMRSGTLILTALIAWLGIDTARDAKQAARQSESAQVRSEENGRRLESVQSEIKSRKVQP